MAEVRTRFAPSPTGYMHIGNLRTALYTFLIARKNNGKFILRIEDTDQERYVGGAVEVIYKTLKVCGINWDEGPDVGGDYGPYIQSRRKGIYMDYARELVESGHAYYCFCSKERLDSLRQEAERNKEPFKYDRHCCSLEPADIQAKLDSKIPFVIRQKMPSTGITLFHDEVFGEIKVENETLDDQILIKSDGLPTYNFANVIDDHLMKISHIVRGSEYLSSTPKYNLLYEAFGWDIPAYVHVSPIMKTKEKKLSKREGDVSFSDFYRKGYLEEAIINYIALLGWSPQSEDEVFSMDELIDKFNTRGISKSPAIFDVQKLNWMNAHYIKEADINKLMDMAVPHLQRAGYVESSLTGEQYEWLQKLVDIHRERLSFVGELPEHARIFFEDDAEPEDDEALAILQEEHVPIVLKAFYDKVREVDTIDENFPKAAFKAVQKETGIKGKGLFMSIRVAITGQMHGPDLYTTVYLLGKEKIMNRLKKHIDS